VEARIRKRQPHAIRKRQGSRDTIVARDSVIKRLMRFHLLLLFFVTAALLIGSLEMNF